MNNKILFILFFLCINLYGFSQKSFDLNIHHDAKFLFTGDNRGNDMGTLDILIKFEIPLIQYSKSYITVFPLFEYADLYTGSLKRYAVGFGYFYKDVFIKKLKIGVLPNYGSISRFNNTTGSFGTDIEMSYRIAKRVSLSYVLQIIERTDLKVTYDENEYIRSSSFIGIKVHL